MKIGHKYAISLAVLLCSLLIAIAIIVVEVLGRAPDYSKKSPSGQYLIESVPASSLLTPRDFVYLRFTDLNNPSQVYRTPLFSELELDMRADEDEKTVGVVFIEFDKSSKAFTLGLSSPKKHWLNFFISNTPYRVLEN
ncbi:MULTISPECIES: hypothetical protein [Pseudomonas]|uniref:Uncharacterized protein n=1 Tax=Pseudomonas lini TaxID=163011 RepID=A0A0J6H8H8_9PSED|nr:MULTISPECIES: hypothetical protein [Pseudomonas]KAB0504437.1 hypothetical protein F7R14_15390 [Pseudomonas lini]KMM90788.1 hypothetical protein TU81_18430 [Pseudomonas lini]KNH47033.1 hypothetical protein ACS73_07275 [Pseudomonas lini]MDT9676046.1 hypothetical protein [Pseudomonas sp. JV414]SDS31944.1 hypothetical protein SAMN04490191_1191 [Pseudomonas lini]